MQLADETPFWLGSLRVDPPLREVAWPGGRALVQPRAMQVLTTLAALRGAVVSRDHLVTHCWGGRAVSNDAIHRIIYLLRALSARSGGAFEIQTISRIGYRLSATDVAPRPAIFTPPDPASDEATLAVLAFDDLTGDPAFEAFTSAITEEISHKIGGSMGLRVIGRSSNLGPADLDVPSIGARLGATHLLLGSVRRAGDQIRVSVELMECASRADIWSRRFERPMDRLSTTPADIALVVSRMLAAAFSRSRGAVAIDPIALDLYLNACETGGAWTLPDTSRLEQAIARAPDFAAAWAQLAFARAMILRWAGGEFAVRAPEVETAARIALTLDPAAGIAWIALNGLQPYCGAHQPKHELVAKALAAAPNDPSVLGAAAGASDTLGYQRRALRRAERAYLQDPQYTCWYYASLHEALGRRAEATAIYDESLARWPESPEIAANALRSAYEAGEWTRFDAIVGGLPAVLKSSLLVGLVLTAAEDQRHWTDAKGRAALERMRRVVEGGRTVSLTGAGLLCGRGLTCEVYDILEQASFADLFRPEGRLQGDFGLNVLFSPTCRAMRQDPRFARLCRKLGLAALWAQSDEWPDCAREVAAFYDFKAEILRELAA